MQVVRSFVRWPGLIGLSGLLLIVWLAAEPIQEAYLQFLGWVFAEVRNFHRILTENVKSLAVEASFATSVALIGSSFLYGVLHAAGPGHGKVILSTYLLSQPEKVKKSIYLAILSAIAQGVVAIVLVYGLYLLFGLATRDTTVAVAWSERLSYALITMIGLWLVWRGLKSAYASYFPTQHSHTHDHDHHDHHDHHHHDHSHDHLAQGAVCSTCGHAHMPTNEQVDAATDWRTTLGVILSIGLRPCTGAILVLVFARFADVSWAGVLAVLAMSLGTALTVSALAITSVGARNFAMKMLGSSGTWGDRLGAYAAIAGGLFLGLIGLGLFYGSFEPATRSMGL